MHPWKLFLNGKGNFLNPTKSCIFNILQIVKYRGDAVGKMYDYNGVLSVAQQGVYLVADCDCWWSSLF